MALPRFALPSFSSHHPLHRLPLSQLMARISSTVAKGRVFIGRTLAHVHRRSPQPPILHSRCRHPSSHTNLCLNTRTTTFRSCSTQLFLPRDLPQYYPCGIQLSDPINHSISRHFHLLRHYPACRACDIFSSGLLKNSTALRAFTSTGGSACSL